MCKMKLLFGVILLSLFGISTDCAKRKHRGEKQGLKFLKSHEEYIGMAFPKRSTPSAGLWPSVFNLATKAAITANATCGEHGKEEFCRMADTGKGRCGICDNFSPDPAKRHSINFAIDSTNRWWQSPAVYYGPQYEFVTITIDLKQVYQIAYIIIKMANSPRPGVWILEKSIDGEIFEPWQYFARTDRECLERFGIPATKGKPHYFTDNEVICTSFYSRLTPMENGEIHTSLIQGRPGANETSPELLEFTKSRFVRFRLIGLRGMQEPMPRWLAQDIFKDKKLFYAIREISIGGQCVCNGHAENCRHNVASGHPECECSHHTCGPNCEICCPMYNQRQWGPGSARDARQCLPCNCHGHATSCHYEEDVDRAGLSMDIHGTYQGGGVCDNCTAYTTGINCEKCLPGYFRSMDTLPEAETPCKQCECDLIGSDGNCIQYGKDAGKCQCRDGFTGEKCEICARGFIGYPDCLPCPCDSKGVINIDECEEGCICKENVEGKYCDRCKPGFFGLKNELEEGCLPCYCSQVTTLCESALIKKQTIGLLKDWHITNLNVSKIVKSKWNGQNVFSLGNYDFSGTNSYWLAPENYLGNKLEAYNSIFFFKTQWVVMRGDTSGEPTKGPNMVIMGSNGMKIGIGNEIYTSSKMSFQVNLTEKNWYHINENSDFVGKKVTRFEFLNILSNISTILLRATFHTDQIEVLLEEAKLEIPDDESGYSSVERCSCPSGYTGLSCESCAFGYVPIISNAFEQNFCVKCDCNGHSETCNPDTGECFCQHQTVGEKCERCAPGYYGNPIRGTQNDCKKCACPLENDENNFSPSCQLDYFIEKEEEEEGSYVCTQCPKGYTGDRCEICDDGYFGNPMEIGNFCQPCDCYGGPCDRVTGQCLSCRGNTEGWKCEKCKPEHYGDPSKFNCKPCECDSIGSVSKQCDNLTGICECKEKFVGRTCDQCEVGYGNVTALCVPCSCNPIGSKFEICNTHSGICECKTGVEGFHCDACQNLFYGFSDEGCKPCECDPDGSIFPSCNQTTGACFCKPHFVGFDCSSCEENYWKKNKVCVECKCNKYGTISNSSCDKNTGKCQCKPGVTGLECNTCLPNHYGNIQSGCKKCDPCNKKGHICNQLNGKCVCPKLTTGTECDSCSENSWGYEPGIGCKECNCSSKGSKNQQCDITKGICSCKIGYEGEKCNRCSFGYYDYPDCKKCRCNQFGTDEEHCQNGFCKCDDKGICKCKENVEGEYCDKCKKNHYGLSKENSKGCISCFCFGRSDNCHDAELHWNKDTRLERTMEEDNQITSDELSLPKAFLGDLTNSYGGYLVVEVEGGFFDVILEGNQVRLTCETNHNELQLTEFADWKVTSRNLDFPIDCIDNLNRNCFMVILQNITLIVIKANNRIKEVLLDKAENELSAYPITHSVEKCDCPSKYTGLSCENPNKGYYRYFSDNPDLSWIDRIIGIARECECNGYSQNCDAETGFCQNCSHHTTGKNCENCEDGFYFDKNHECKPCLCPSAEQNNAKSCKTDFVGGFICQCKTGYSGIHCNKCDTKYYSPINSTFCVPCNCNQYGIRDNGICDENGKCNCQDGFTGDKCNQCVKDREYIENGVCKSCDECSMLLFDEIDTMKEDIETIFDMFKNGIAPPWRKLTDNLNKYKMLSTKYKKSKIDLDRLIETNKIDTIENKVKNIQKRIDKNNELLDYNIDKSDKIFDNSSKLLEESDDLGRKLIDIIDSLNKFGNNKQINLKEALDKSRQILIEIQNSSNSINNNINNNNEIFNYCLRINRKVDSIYGTPKIILPNIDKLKNKIDKLFDLVTNIENLIKLGDNKNIKNLKNLENIREKIEILKSKHHYLNNSMNEIVLKLNATEDILESLNIVYNDLNTISNLKEYQELEERVKREMEEIPIVQNFYDKAVEHVENLEQKVEEYHSIFNFTKDEWKKINASGAYEAIIKGISETRNNIKESKEKLKQAKEIIIPENSDSLDTTANIAQSYSDRLKQRINNLKNRANPLNEMKNRIEDLKHSILKTGQSNNQVSQNLLQTNQNITSQAEKVARLEKSIKTASEISDRMNEIRKKVDGIAFNKQFSLDKKYQKYQEQIHPKEMKQLNSNLKSAQEVLNNLKIKEKLKNGKQNDKRNNVDNKINGLEMKIKELESIIKLAKQQIDVVDVPMNLTNCLMTYKPTKTQYFQSLSITFNCQNCNLFKWIKSSTTNLFSIKVENGKLVIEIKDESISIPSKLIGENTVLIQKSDSLIKVQLGAEQRSISNSLNEMLEIDDIIEIGDNTTRENNPNHEQDTNYIYKMILNGEQFGLWHYTETNHKCFGQRRNATTDDSMSNFYTGNGYFEYGSNTNLNPKQFSIRFEFSTFDENSTIYVAAHFQTCSFIHLYIENGFLNFFIRLNNNETTKVINNVRVNDAKTHLAEISWKLESSKKKLMIKYTLGVDNQIQPTERQQIDRENVFKIKETKHYVGGVPPTFNKTCIPLEKPAFLGFLELKSQLNTPTVSYGIIKSRVISFNHAWINQNGYIKLSFPKEVLKIVKFILRPISQTGIIIKFNNNKNLSLKNGNIIINQEEYDSNINLNDYNDIKIIIDTKQLIINGKVQNLTFISNILIEDLQIGSKNDGFEGEIRDISINNKQIFFDNSTVNELENVEIGREKPFPTNSSLNVKSLTNSMQNTDRCVDFDENDIEKVAVKFGDKPNSFTYIKTNFWKGNFTLQFDFRTFYPNGVIFISMNKRRNYILLELKDGQLQLNIEGRKKKIKTLPISNSDRKMNNGEWHHIRLTKKLKKLTVIIDKESKPSRINVRIKPKDEIYFGGVPLDSEYFDLPNLKNHLVPFRGCMRLLEINNEQQFLVNNKNVQHSNISLCFSKVEEGAYFGGDAYATYKTDFQISEMLELSFELKTSEQNGILMSVSNDENSPAFSLELQNGAIVMAVNLGNGIVTNVTNNLNSEMALCNNNWHNVSAMYSSSELTVSVDGIRKSWVQSDFNSTMDQMEAPLYIGGLPDLAPVGTLKSLQNFKGCIRNVKIENQLIDWEKMNNLNNVLLDSCPN